GGYDTSFWVYCSKNTTHARQTFEIGGSLWVIRIFYTATWSKEVLRFETEHENRKKPVCLKLFY
ncbi:MAG: hypothetical protein ABFR65_01620, partial [Pseudomonadota bacterium]